MPKPRDFALLRRIALTIAVGTLSTVPCGPLMAQGINFTELTDLGAPTGTECGWHWADLDSDGDLDAISTGSSARVFLNDGTGAFTSVALGNHPRQGALLDIDGDLDLDFYTRDELFYENNGSGTFSSVGNLGIDLPADNEGVAGGDTDLDGWCDVLNFSGNGNWLGLHLGTTNPPSFDETDSTFYGMNGPGSAGNGDYVSSGDANNDGYLDFFYHYNGGQLFLSDGDGTFTENSSGISVVTGNTDKMGSAWGDYDNDGDLDLYVCREEPGQVGYLWRNDGATFTDVTLPAGIASTASQRSCVWGDSDNDGDLDLYITCLPSDPNVYYENQGNGTFLDVDLQISAPGDSGDAAFVDVDNDGDLDLVVSQWAGNPRLFRNNTDSADYLKVRLEGMGAGATNTACVGVRIELYDASGSVYLGRREVGVARGFGGSEPLWAHFGGVLPNSSYQIRIYFHSRPVTNPLIVAAIPALTSSVIGGNTVPQLLTVIEPPPPPSLNSITPTTGSPLGGDLVTLSGSQFTFTTTVEFGGIDASSVNFIDVNMLEAVTPANSPGVVDVAVINENGSDALAGGFTYQTPPTVTSVSPTSGTPLGGEFVTVTGSEFTPTTTVAFGGTASPSVTFIDANTLATVTPSHAPGFVDVAAANENGSDTLSSGYLYLDPPNLSSITPTVGDPAGGDTVTLSGSGFTATSVVVFGGSTAPSVTFVDANTLTATTPAHAPGLVDVEVSNENGTSTLPQAFNFALPPPILTSVTPNYGGELGGDNVTLAGNEFTVGTSVTFDGLAAAVTFVDVNTLTVTTPAHAPGAVTVDVSTVNGSDAIVGGFTYVGPPVITGLSPTDGSIAGGTIVSIAGSGLTPSTFVLFDGVAASVTFVDFNTLEASTPAHAAGTVDVQVANPSGSDLAIGAFTYRDPPTLTGVVPDNGPPAGGNTVTVTGTEFTPSTTATFAGVAATSVTFVDASTLEVVPPRHAAGIVDVTVMNSSGSDTLTSAYTYNVPPVLTEISPIEGSPAGGESVSFSGSDFTPDATVDFSGVAAAFVAYVDQATLSVVTPPHAPGTVDVTVTNLNGTTTLLGAFTFNPPPVLTSLSPANGTPAGGDTITLSGSAFTAGDIVTFGGVVSPAVMFIDVATLSAVTPPHTPGAVDVEVSNANGAGALAGAFTYNSPPTLLSLSPADGTPLGGTQVTVTGSDFTPTTSVLFAGVAATVTYVDSTTLLVDTPAQPAGPVNVEVMNENGSDLAPGAFTYNAAPQVVAVSPNQGIPAGGDLVTVSGANFTLDAVVSFDGIAAPTTFVDASTLEATSPAHPSGPVGVSVTNVNGIGLLASGFLYLAPPTLASVTPDRAPLAGGTSVTMTGTGFTTSDIVSFGVVAAPAVTFVDTQTLEVTTPAHAAGVVDITLVGPAGSDVLTQGFSYLPPPTITQVAPSQGATTGGTTVTVTGTDFSDMGDVTVSFGGNPATILSVTNGTSVVLQTPVGSAGLVDVTVTTTGGSDTLTTGYEYVQLSFRRGDGNNDGTVNIADGIFLIQYLFLMLTEPSCFDAADTNDDGGLNISDIVFSISYIFQQGAPPPAPFPLCGVDPTNDALECVSFTGC